MIKYSDGISRPRINNWDDESMFQLLDDIVMRYGTFDAIYSYDSLLDGYHEGDTRYATIDPIVYTILSGYIKSGVNIPICDYWEAIYIGINDTTLL